MKKLVVTFLLEEIEEEDYTHFKYTGIEVSGDLNEGERSGLAEAWAQSDEYWVNICNDIVTSI